MIVIASLLFRLTFVFIRLMRVCCFTTAYLLKAWTQLQDHIYCRLPFAVCSNYCLHISTLRLTRLSYRA